MSEINKNNLQKERLGETKINSQGIEMKICEYHNSNDIWVEFQDNFKAKVHCSYERFQQGKVKNPNVIHPATISSRLGETAYNTQGCKMTIIKYNTANDLIVEFENGYKTHGLYKDFKKGNIKNLYYPSIFGKAYIGKKYPIYDNKKPSKEYRTWFNMLTRCYDPKWKMNYPVYEECECCNEWLNFENFYEWVHNQENFETWKRLNRSALDKDIIIKHNKVYSPSTCLLVPCNINVLFTRNEKNRGKYPIGVTLHEETGLYKAYCSDGCKRTEHLGLYNTPKEAFETYKRYKEQLIKDIAQKSYKNQEISQRCYEAMNKYIVEITD